VGLKALSQENLALPYVLPGSEQDFMPFFIGTGPHPFPKIGPFHIGVVLEIAGATVVRTPFASEADPGGGPVVSLFHLGIELRQLLEMVAF
jgi:hypothetical protein